MPVDFTGDTVLTGSDTLVDALGDPLTDAVGDTIVAPGAAPTPWPSPFIELTAVPGSSAYLASNRGRITLPAISGYASTHAMGYQPDSNDYTITVDLVVVQVGIEQFQRVAWRNTDGDGINQLQFELGINYVSVDRQNSDFTRQNYYSAGATWVIGDVVHVRIQAAGSSHKVRWWRNAESEPGTWAVEFTDPIGTVALGDSLVDNLGDPIVDAGNDPLADNTGSVGISHVVLQAQGGSTYGGGSYDFDNWDLVVGLAPQTVNLATAVAVSTARPFAISTTSPNPGPNQTITLVPAVALAQAVAGNVFVTAPPAPQPPDVPPIVTPPPVVVVEPVEDQPVAVAWHIYVIDNTGTRVAELEDYTTATVIPRFNAVGAWTLSAYDTDVARLLLLDQYGIEVVHGSEVVLTGPATSKRRILNPNTTGQVFRGFEYGGVDDLDFLRRRLASPRPSLPQPPYTVDYDVRTGKASTVIAQYVNVNLGPSAVLSRRVAGVTIATDPFAGATVTGRARWQTVLELAQSLATAGGVGFRMRRRQFETYLPVDRSGVVKFSIPLGTIRGFEYTDEIAATNHPVVAGGGEGVARVVLESDDAASATRWGRIETFVDQRQTVDTTELQQAAAEALTDGAAKQGFSIDVVDGPLRYLTDYSLGDRVEVTVDGESIVDVVTEVRLAFGPGGVETTPTIGATDMNQPKTFDLIARLARRVRNLERR